MTMIAILSILTSLIERRGPFIMRHSWIILSSNVAEVPWRQHAMAVSSR